MARPHRIPPADFAAMLAEIGRARQALVTQTGEYLESKLLALVGGLEGLEEAYGGYPSVSVDDPDLFEALWQEALNRGIPEVEKEASRYRGALKRSNYGAQRAAARKVAAREMGKLRKEQRPGKGRRRERWQYHRELSEAPWEAPRLSDRWTPRLHVPGEPYKPRERLQERSTKQVLKELGYWMEEGATTKDPHSARLIAGHIKERLRELERRMLKEGLSRRELMRTAGAKVAAKLMPANLGLPRTMGRRGAAALVLRKLLGG